MSSLFQGKKLQKVENGQFVNADASALEGKVLALYFSAHWCPPCRQFTPVLKDFYDEVVASGANFEIVFISSDRSAEEQLSYMSDAHGAWVTLAHSEASGKKELAEKFGVSGIPKLVVLKANGEMITENGRADVTGQGPVKAWSTWSA